MSSEPAVRDWRYFSEAVSWYGTPGIQTGAQIFSVVQAITRALADGRITPADLGIDLELEGDSMAACPKCRCLVNSPCPSCGAPMILVSERMAICDRNRFHCFKPMAVPPTEPT